MLRLLEGIEYSDVHGELFSLLCMAAIELFFLEPDAASLGHFPFEAFPFAIGSQPKLVASFQA